MQLSQRAPMSRDMASLWLPTRRILPTVGANTCYEIVPDHVDQNVAAVGVAGVNIDVEDWTPVDGDDQTSVGKRNDGPSGVYDLVAQIKRVNEALDGLRRKRWLRRRGCLT